MGYESTTSEEMAGWLLFVIVAYFVCLFLGFTIWLVCSDGKGDDLGVQGGGNGNQAQSRDGRW